MGASREKPRNTRTTRKKTKREERGDRSGFPELLYNSFLSFFRVVRVFRGFSLMAYESLAAFLEELEAEGELVRIKAEVDPILEISEITDRISTAHGPALLF